MTPCTRATQTGKFMVTENGVVAGAEREERMERDCLMGIDFQYGGDEKVLEIRL